MFFYPAIDIKDSACVRLLRGDMDTAVKFNENPLDQIREFENAGCKWVHVVDLNAAVSGNSVHGELIKNMVSSSSLKVQMGGGVRSIDDIEHWLDQGVSRVVIGSLAVKKPDIVADIAKKFGNKVAVAVDCHNGYVSASGWTETSDLLAEDYVKFLEKSGIEIIIFTDISKDGTLQGPNISAINKVMNASSLKVIASGGVSSINDLRTLKTKCINLEGIISGRAIYEKLLDIKEAVDFLSM